MSCRPARDAHRHEGKTTHVRGLATSGPLTVGIEGAQLTVWIWDVARLDAPAALVTSWSQSGLSAQAGSMLAVAFAVSVRSARPHERLVLRAHLDVDLSGQVSRGDYVSVQSYPLEQFMNETPGTLVLKRLD